MTTRHLPCSSLSLVSVLPTPAAARVSRRRWGAGLLGLGALGLAGGCTGSLLPKPPAQPELFTLDDGAAETPAAALPGRAAAGATLLVDTPRAAAGFDTPHIVYLRRAHELEHFAYSRWAATPAQMLAPLMAGALQRSGRFAAVLRVPSTAVATLRLDSELVRLQHDFSQSPSRVRLTLRVVLVEITSRRVLATREFDVSEPAGSEDAYGGVTAAHRALRRVLADLPAFCAQAA